MITTGLWERSPRPDAREQVTLFNIVTATAVGIGVSVLYVALFIIMLARRCSSCQQTFLASSSATPLALRTRSGSRGWPPPRPSMHRTLSTIAAGRRP